MDWPTFKRYLILQNLVRYHDRMYYDNDSPILSDKEYDLLYDKLTEMESEYPEWICEDSPSQKVGGKVSGKFNKIKHKAPMYSLSKVKTVEEFIAWDERMKKLLNLTQG